MGRKRGRKRAKKATARRQEAGQKAPSTGQAAGPTPDEASNDPPAPSTERPAPAAAPEEILPAATPTPRTRKVRKGGPTFLKRIISARRGGQIVFGIALYLALANGWLSLNAIIVGGSLLGILLGKVFCRWMCPMGLLMDVIMGAGPDAQSKLYMYYKLGCPIAWISGFLNRFSLWKVRRKADHCVDCGLCDKACYITQFNPEASLFKSGGLNPSSYYTCSRCLECVQACPTNALTLSVKDPVLPPGRPHEAAPGAE